MQGKGTFKIAFCEFFPFSIPFLAPLCFVTFSIKSIFTHLTHIHISLTHRYSPHTLKPPNFPSPIFCSAETFRSPNLLMSIPCRVVVTGIGAVSPLGPTFEQSFSSLMQSVSSTSNIDDPSFSSLPCNVAASVPTPSTPSPPSVTQQKSRFIQHAVSASLDALSSSSLPLSSTSSYAHGVSIGSGIGSIIDICDASDKLKKSHRKVRLDKDSWRDR